MKEIRFTSMARQELADAVAYYEEREEKLGERFQAEVKKVELILSERAESYRKVDDKYRRILLRDFPYAIFYRILDHNFVRVVAVMHLHRRPNYWKQNV